MTLEEVKALSDEELRIKVAELCGWIEMGVVDDWWYDDCGTYQAPAVVGYKTIEHAKHKAQMIAPDYPQDLNAMREAEALLSNEQANDYWAYLINIAQGGKIVGGVKRHYAHATARQRAEAFVLTRG